MAHLVVKKGSGNQTIFQIKGNSTVIGRGRTCDLVLPDISVSRNHALIERTKEGDKFQYVIKDMGSKNAFFVNGQPTKGHRLKDNDQVTLGKFMLRFHLESGIEAQSAHKRYSLSGREGYLDRVTAIAGEQVHSTTALSPEELKKKVKMMRRKDAAVFRRAGKPGAEWTPTTKGIAFGKGGIAISGMGMGGRVVVIWKEDHHEIHRDGGFMYTLEVNRKPVKSASLQGGDLIQIGKEMFEYIE
jgi:pSer/pThr/pTyr-binding forkhead associated (FHA) protein